MPPSSNLISWNSSMVFDRNGRTNKTLNKLNDGDLETKINDGSSENDFVLPYNSMIVLPNLLNNMKVEVWESFGSGGTIYFRLYNASKTLLGTYSITKSAFNSWITNNPAQTSGGVVMDAQTSVAFLEIHFEDATDLNIGVYELRIYGDEAGDGVDIYNGTAITPLSDPGKYGFGIGNIDDRVQQYLVGSPTTYLVPLMAASVRIGFEGMRWNIYPDSYDDPLVDSPFDLGRFGNDHLNTRIFDFTKPRDMQVQIYHGGGSIKNLSGAEAATSNGEYHPEVNDFKYLESGANAEDTASWAAKAKTTSALGVLYGDNESASLTGITVTNGDATVGQGGLHDVETGNELTRDWAGLVPYHNPRGYLALQKACWDDAKARNGTTRVVMPANTYMNISQWRAIFFEHYWGYGKVTFPADAACMNLYLNSDLDGQSQSGDSTGLNPEAWNLYDRLVTLKTEVMDIMFPNIPVIMTEIGYATSSDSGYDVSAIGSKTARQVAADLTLRVYAITQCAGRIVERIYYYAFFEDGSGNFDSMGATAMTFAVPSGSYLGNTVYPVGYCLANQLFVEKDYEWFSTRVVDGGTTGAWITSKNHPTDPVKKLFKVWRGTMNGSTSVETVTVGPNALTATLYTLRYNEFTPSTTTPSIIGEGVDVSATEGMQWLEVTYTAAENEPPVANAGADQSITLPTSQVTVDGSASSDPDGTITTYLWTKISGPATFTITDPSSVSTTITGLVVGTYVFRLTVTDNDSATDTDDITITVNASNRRSWFRGSLRGNKFRRG
jgi:hypothetical protein